MLRMKRETLARQADVAVATLADFEVSRRTPHPRTLAAIRSALELAGIEFTNDAGIAGVRLRRRWMIIQNALEGFVKVDDVVSIFENPEYETNLAIKTPQGVTPVHPPPKVGEYINTYVKPGDGGTVIDVRRKTYDDAEGGHYDYVAFR